MSLTVSAINVATQWTQTRSNSPFGTSTQGPDSLVYSATPSTTTYSEVYLGSYSVAASGTQNLDFRSFTSTLGASVTATKIIAIMLKATATVTGAKMKIEPGASNALTWFFGGTSPYIELEVGTDGACFFAGEGVAETVDGTHKNILITNSGTQTMTLSVYGLVGTT
jgi:hypothetical protein